MKSCEDDAGVCQTIYGETWLTVCVSGAVNAQYTENCSAGNLICDEGFQSCEEPAAGCTETDACNAEVLNTADSCKAKYQDISASGDIKCSEDCSTIDYSACLYCGDGKITAEQGEECDGDNIGDLTCADYDSSKTWKSGGSPACDNCLLTAGTCEEETENPNACIDGVDAYRCADGVRQACTDGEWKAAVCADVTGAVVTCDKTGVDFCKVQCNAADHYVAGENNTCKCADNWGGNDCSCDLSLNTWADNTCTPKAAAQCEQNSECVSGNRQGECKGDPKVCDYSAGTCVDGYAGTDCICNLSTHYWTGTECKAQCKVGDFMMCSDDGKQVVYKSATCEIEEKSCPNNGDICKGTGCVAASVAIRCDNKPLGSKRCSANGIEECKADGINGKWEVLNACGVYGCNSDNTNCASEAWCSSTTNIHCGDAPENGKWTCLAKVCTITCNTNFELVNNKCVPVCGANQHRNESGTCVPDCEVVEKFKECKDDKYKVVVKQDKNCTEKTSTVACGANEICSAADKGCKQVASVIECSGGAAVGTERCTDGVMEKCTLASNGTSASWVKGTKCQFGCNSNNTNCETTTCKNYKDGKEYNTIPVDTLGCTREGKWFICGDDAAAACDDGQYCNPDAGTNDDNICLDYCGEGQVYKDGKCEPIQCENYKGGVFYNTIPYDTYGCTKDGLVFVCGLDGEKEACDGYLACNPDAGSDGDSTCRKCTADNECPSYLGFAGQCREDGTCDVYYEKCDDEHIMYNKECVECLKDDDCDVFEGHPGICDSDKKMCDFDINSCIGDLKLDEHGNCVGTVCTPGTSKATCSTVAGDEQSGKPNQITYCSDTGSWETVDCLLGCDAGSSECRTDMNCTLSTYHEWVNYLGSTISCVGGHIRVSCKNDDACPNGYACDMAKNYCIEKSVTPDDPVWVNTFENYKACNVVNKACDCTDNYLKLTVNKDYVCKNISTTTTPISLTKDAGTRMVDDEGYIEVGNNIGALYDTEKAIENATDYLSFKLDGDSIDRLNGKKQVMVQFNWKAKSEQYKHIGAVIVANGNVVGSYTLTNDSSALQNRAFVSDYMTLTTPKVTSMEIRIIPFALTAEGEKSFSQYFYVKDIMVRAK